MTKTKRPVWCTRHIADYGWHSGQFECWCVGKNSGLWWKQYCGKHHRTRADAERHAARLTSGKALPECVF